MPPQQPDAQLSALLDQPVPDARRGEGVRFPAVVLAAGAGRRLRPLTDRYCKPLVPVLNVPLLYWTAAALLSAGAAALAVNAHHRAEQIEAAAAVLRRRCPIPVAVVREERPSGPAGGVLACRDALDPDPCLVVVNGDAATDLDVAGLVADHLAQRADLTVFARPVPDPARFGTLRLDGREVVGMVEKSPDSPPGSVVNCGVYAFSARALRALAAPAGAAEYDVVHVLPQLRRRGYRVIAHSPGAHWDDVGSSDALLRTNLRMLGGPALARVARADAVRPGLWRQGEQHVEAGVAVAGRVLLGAGARVGAAAHVEDSVVGAGARIGARARVRGSVVLPGARVPAGADLAGRLHG